MPKRDGKDQGEDGPKHKGSCLFAHNSCLPISDANSYLTGGVRVVFKPSAFVQSFFVVQYAFAPTATRSYLIIDCVLLFLLFFVFLEVSLFPSISVPLKFLCLYGKYAARFPLWVEFFYLVTTGCIFDIRFCPNSTKKICFNLHCKLTVDVGLIRASLCTDV